MAADPPGAPGAPPQPPRIPLVLDAPPLAQLDACVGCGFCLPACPTYRELGQEADSPRGRIAMIGAATRGEISADLPDLALHLDRCLDCRACETACPSGVRYHVLYEAAVAALPPRAPAEAPLAPPPPGATRRILRLALRQLAARPRLLAAAMRAARTPLSRILPPAFRQLAGALPRAPQRPARFRPRAAAPGPAPRGPAALFLGCVQDAAMGDDNAAAAAVLTAWGFDVRVPDAQTCCGALHIHLGDASAAARLCGRNAAAFAGAGPVVTVAAGCSAVLAEYGSAHAGSPVEAQAADLASRVRDLAVLLDSVPEAERPAAGRVTRRREPVTVTYHDPCHLAHAQGVRRAPRRLIAALPGLRLVELPEADACCGSAGVYNLTQPELSRAILERKVANVLATGAEWVVTANPGCILQLRAGLAAAGSEARVMSLAGLLALAYAPSAGGGAD